MIEGLCLAAMRLSVWSAVLCCLGPPSLAFTPSSREIGRPLTRRPVISTSDDIEPVRLWLEVPSDLEPGVALEMLQRDVPGCHVDSLVLRHDPTVPFAEKPYFVAVEDSEDTRTLVDAEGATIGRSFHIDSTNVFGVVADILGLVASE